VAAPLLQISRHQVFLSLPSFAKINWRLQIIGKRPDGYHEVKTSLQTISLHDDLEFRRADDGTVTLSSNQQDIPTDDRNLIIRAAYALRDRYRIESGVDIRLEKRIPTKAGLGGASSNAAVALLALARLWEIQTEDAALREIASGLGADVPFFLLGGCALATGIGAVVSALEDGDLRHLIVIKPNAEVSTADAYAALHATALTTINTDSILSSSVEASNSRDSQLWPGPNKSKWILRNDFESVIFEMEPEISRAKEALLHAGASSALLAGSGSSVFGIFATRELQQRALNEIKLEAGWRSFPCVTVPRAEYDRALGLRR
jgi:4-diphosphocytidyl-2-C-methyl-D-erythritol kinase